MTPPPTHPNKAVVNRLTAATSQERHSPCGIEEQSPAARRLAWLLWHAAEDLFDAATEVEVAYMWEQGRAIASRILAACPVD